MKLIQGAELFRKDGELLLRLDDKTQTIRESDRYIFLAMSSEGMDDAALIELVTKRESIGEITAELRLAQLVLDYGEYLASTDMRIIDA